MSASPSGRSNGQTPTPNGGPPQFMRKPRAPKDPFHVRKKPAPNRQAYSIPVNGVPRPAPQRAPVGGLINPSKAAAPSKVPPPIQYKPVPMTDAQRANGGWTNAPTGPFQDFPLFTTKRALKEGLRYHIARFSGKRDVDPSNQEDFTRPVVLHRRDPKQPTGKGAKDEEPEDTLMDSKEREKQEIMKAEKEKQRALDLAQIAPTGNNASAIAAKKSQAFRNEKTTQVHRLDKTEEDKRKSDLRYEEALPWHIEDADNKNTWVGNYEAALSDCNVMFVIEGTNFKMIPIEKWYKFTQKGQFKTFTADEVETHMGKKLKESRWVMRTNELNQEERGRQETRSTLGKLFTVKAESATFKNAARTETADMDDLDFEGDDLFQDDDEQVTVEKQEDEDTKDAQERIKREQLAANIFDQANEAEVDKELVDEEKETEKRRKFGKDVKKALKKRERNLIYDSDSEDHPYSETSEDDTSDEEKQAEIDRKKDEEAKNKAKLENASKLPSGTSSKGTNTPSGRPKHSDPLKKGIKRPNDSNLSESSGNESSRKKQKKKHHSQPQPNTGSNTPRATSPVPSSSAPVQGSAQGGRKTSIVKLSLNGTKLADISSAPPNPSPMGNGAMSDGEATGGEMSDGAGGKKRKLKIRLNSGASPNGSRAGSPAPGRQGSIGAGGSRATSPAALAATGSQTPTPGQGPIQPHEIMAALPSTGIAIGELMKMFAGRVGTIKGQQTERTEFIRLVKENSAYGKDKLLRPK